MGDVLATGIRWCKTHQSASRRPPECDMAYISKVQHTVLSPYGCDVVGPVSVVVGNVTELIETIHTWAKAYPESVFPEPPAGEHGQTVDACSARALRHALGALAGMVTGYDKETEQ